MGVSINTRKVSFHERFIIREIMPSVLMSVLSSTLTFRPTVLPIKLVSLDNLEVTSPAQKMFGHHLLSCSFVLVQSVSFILCPILLCLACLVQYVMSGLALSCPVLQCPVFIYAMSSLDLKLLYNCMLYQRMSLTCLCGLKESNFLFGQCLKQPDFHSACVGTDGTKQETPSAACTHRANQPIKEKASEMLPMSTRNMLMDGCGGKTLSHTFPESTGP